MKHQHCSHCYTLIKIRPIRAAREIHLSHITHVASLYERMKCHVQEARLGQVWRYHISWYQDPNRLDNVVLVRSRPREGGEKLDISSWTNEVDGGGGSPETPIVFYVKVSWPRRHLLSRVKSSFPGVCCRPACCGG